MQLKIFSIGNSGILRDFIYFSCLALISIVLGVLINCLRSKPLPLVYQSPAERIQQFTASWAVAGGQQPQSVEEIDLNTLRSLLDKGSIVILDARSAKFYERGHIPTAVRLSRENFEGDFERLLPKLMSPPVKTLVVYCSDKSCEDGITIAKSLAEMGFKSILLFKGGWEAWERAGLSVEKGEGGGKVRMEGSVLKKSEQRN